MDGRDIGTVVFPDADSPRDEEDKAHRCVIVGILQSIPFHRQSFLRLERLLSCFEEVLRAKSQIADLQPTTHKIPNRNFSYSQFPTPTLLGLTSSTR